jgi:hypothetical protein
VERSHRIDNDEFYKLLDGVVIDDTGLFNEKLREWEDFYNFTDRTAATAAKPPTNVCYNEPSNQPQPRNRPASVPHLGGVGGTSGYVRRRAPFGAGDRFGAVVVGADCVIDTVGRRDVLGLQTLPRWIGLMRSSS